MTPISHSFFGLTTGFILSPFTRKLGISRKRTVLLCTLGSLIPDIDSISLILNRQIYYGSKWYSHHGILHSVFGVFLLAFAIMLVIEPLLWFRILKSRDALKTWIVSFVLLFIGAMIHLLCDMVTPPGPWEGIPVLAPFSWSRFGGWQHIYWKDFYLIYISIFTYLVFGTIWMVESLLKKRTFVLPAISIIVLSWAIYHVNGSRYTKPSQWEIEQKHLVGQDLYRLGDRASKEVNKLWHTKTLF